MLSAFLFISHDAILLLARVRSRINVNSAKHKHIAEMKKMCKYSTIQPHLQ